MIDFHADTYRSLRKALCSAFPDREDFEKLMRFKFDTELNSIVSNQDSTSSIAFKLTMWAEQQGRLEDFVRRSRRFNPRNDKLTAFSVQVGWYDDIPITSDPPSSAAEHADVSVPPVAPAPVHVGYPGGMLLSEFDALPRLRRVLADRRWRRFAAVALILIAVLAIGLAKLSGAACMRATFLNPETSETRTILFGFLGEVSHGLSNIVILPLFFIMSLRFLEVVTNALGQLEESRLVVLDSQGAVIHNSRPSVLVSDLNRKYFRIIAPFATVFALGFVGTVEIVGYHHVAFGWVQAIAVPNHVGKLTGDMEAQGQTGHLAVTDSLCSAPTRCSVRVLSVEGGSITSQQRMLFVPFLVVSLGLQVFFAGFGLWIAAKIMFVLLVLDKSIKRAQASPFRSTVYRGQPDVIQSWYGQLGPRALCLRMDFTDPVARLGLKPVDSVYRGALLLVAVYSFWRFLVVMSNYAKGTDMISSGFTGHLYLSSQLITFGVIFLVLTASFIVPAILFDVRVQKLKALVVQKLDRLIESVSDLPLTDDPAARLKDVRAVAEEQSPSPIRSAAFRWLAFVIAPLVLLVPLAIDAPIASAVLRPVERTFAWHIPSLFCPPVEGGLRACR